MNVNENSLWLEIKSMFTNSDHDVVLFENESEHGRKSLEILGVTRNSALGSIVFNTSGIMIDNWLRILGHENGNNRGIVSCSLISENGTAPRLEKMLMVADDVLGGIFALNAGKFTAGIGEIWYFAPDTLDWENLGLQYSEFIAWAAQGDMDGFYASLRWSTWKNDCEEIGFNEALQIYPFLWSREIDLETASKKKVRAEELFAILNE